MHYLCKFMLQTQHIYNNNQKGNWALNKIKIDTILAVSHIHLDWQWYINRLFKKKKKSVVTLQVNFAPQVFLSEIKNSNKVILLKQSKYRGTKQRSLVHWLYCKLFMTQNCKYNFSDTHFAEPMFPVLNLTYNRGG